VGKEGIDFNEMRKGIIHAKDVKFSQSFLRTSYLVFRTLLIPAVIFLPQTGFAHTVAYDFESMSSVNIGWQYLKMGFTHIIPFGYDHILFILGVFLLKPEIKSVIWQASAFTVAHSITLGLAIYGVIHPVPSFVEPVIALSIVFIALENIFAVELKWWRVGVVFLFGLIHGCGFSGALLETGLPKNDFLLALLSFNGGVESGQILIIALAYFLTIRVVKDKAKFRRVITIPASLCIFIIAVYWTIERSLN
jgi:hydrogenase/urease accessory protein HupE